MAGSLKTACIFVLIFALSVLPSEESPLHRFVMETKSSHDAMKLSALKINLASSTQSPLVPTTSTWMWIEPQDIGLGKKHMEAKFPNVDWDKEWDHLITDTRSENGHDQQFEK